jgi:hypothetical protein
MRMQREFGKKACAKCMHRDRVECLRQKYAHCTEACTMGKHSTLHVHCKKKLAIFAFPAGMSITKLYMAGNNLIIHG